VFPVESETQSEAISALAFEVAAELLRPVTREVQDDR